MDQTPPRAAGSSLPAVVDVDLGDRSYPIYIGSGLLNHPDLLQRDPRALAYAIKRSCQNKAEVVSLDEKEGGLRATLNLGHTFGHVDKKIADGLLRLVLLKGPLGSCVAPWVAVCSRVTDRKAP